MAVLDPAGVEASGSQSLGSRTVCISCLPRLHVLKHIVKHFSGHGQDNYKGLCNGWVRGGGG